MSSIYKTLKPTVYICAYQIYQEIKGWISNTFLKALAINLDLFKTIIEKISLNLRLNSDL